MLRLREVKVVLSVETTFSVRVVGWVGGWRKRDSGYLIFKVEVEVEDELGNKDCTTWGLLVMAF